MQSRYGGVSEMQQFLVDGCAPTLFTISPPSLPPANPSAAADIHAAAPRHYHSLHHQPHPHHPPTPEHLHPAAPQPPASFPHFHHPIPITQQLFQQTHHPFQLFHHPHPHQRPHPHPHHQQPEPRRVLPHHQLGMDRESAAPENSSSPIRMMGANGGGGGGPPPSFLAAAMNFKLAVNESSGGGSREGLNDEEGILQDDDGSESRFHPWRKEEESCIKEPFWRPLDLDYINRSKDKEPETSTNTYSKKSKEVSEQGHGNPTSGSNYKLFSELEAIYKPGGRSTNAGGGGNNQTGSGSVLTGDENPIPTAAAPGPTSDPHAGSANHASDTSTGGGEPLPSKFVKGSGRKKRKRRHQQQQLSSIAVFFEGLVKQLMDHQESLHRKFLEVMEKRDQERTGREEAWRRQEAAKSSSEAAARAQERALAATREAAIISFLEKMTGESLNLPTKAQFQSQLLEELQKENNTDTSLNPLEPAEGFNNSNADRVQLNNSRWPRAEVQALIRVRSGLEARFQEPGLKGPLWEEVSASMATLGYYRSSKRCKEKWENINKYFRKTKDSGKKRPQHSKTCPYFYQLDQLYSKSSLNKGLLPSSSSSPNQATATAGERRDNSELLDAILAPADNPNNFSFPELGYLENDYSSKMGDNAEASGASTMAAKGTRNGDDEDDEGEDEGEEEEREEKEMEMEEEEEEEEESQGQWTEQQQ